MASESPINCEIYARAFTRCFWGLLFIGITAGPIIPLVRDAQEAVRIDILPDWIGYLLLAQAAHLLLPMHPRAARIRLLALALVFLSMFTCVQFGTKLGKFGSLTWWAKPSPAMVFAMAIDLLKFWLVWNLCGLVAELGRAYDQQAVAGRAVFRRNLYLASIVLGWLLALVPVSSRQDQLVLMGISLGVEVVVTALLMGLMRQARTICMTPTPAAWTFSPASQPAAVSGSIRMRVLMAAALVVPCLYFGGLLTYYIIWDRTRMERAYQDEGPFEEVLDRFNADLQAGRWQDAYDATTERFKQRTTREQFEKSLASLPLNKAEYQGGRSAGGAHGQKYLDRWYSFKADGITLQLRIVVRREDSIFYWEPSPPRVDQVQVGPAFAALDR